MFSFPRCCYSLSMSLFLCFPSLLLCFHLLFLCFPWPFPFFPRQLFSLMFLFFPSLFLCFLFRILGFPLLLLDFPSLFLFSLPGCSDEYAWTGYCWKYSPPHLKVTNEPWLSIAGMFFVLARPCPCHGDACAIFEYCWHYVFLLPAFRPCHNDEHGLTGYGWHSICACPHHARAIVMNNA